MARYAFNPSEVWASEARVQGSLLAGSPGLREDVLPPMFGWHVPWDSPLPYVGLEFVKTASRFNRAWHNLMPGIILVPDPQTGRSRGRVRQGIAKQSLNVHARSVIPITP